MKTINGSPYCPEVHGQLNDPKFVNDNPFVSNMFDEPNYEQQIDLHVKAQTLLLPFLYDECVKVLKALGKEPGSDIGYMEFWYKAEQVCTAKPEFNRTGWLCMNSFNTWEPVIDKVLLHLGISPDSLAGNNLKGTDVFPTWNMDAILEHIFGIVFTDRDT